VDFGCPRKAGIVKKVATGKDGTRLWPPIKGSGVTGGPGSAAWAKRERKGKKGGTRPAGLNRERKRYRIGGEGNSKA